MMQVGVFPWYQAHLEEPMSIVEGANGRVLNQGHHRWVAARLAGVTIPVKIEIRQDYRNDPVPFAIPWEQVVWETRMSGQLNLWKRAIYIELYDALAHFRWQQLAARAVADRGVAVSDLRCRRMV
jgi:hypothetical protein